ncbi:MAG: hypothetical protein QM791_05315 [Ferruginibacter sp.]
MAKIIYVCVRNQEDVPAVKRKVSFITKKLVPDNIPDAECKTAAYGNIVYGISTYTKLINEKDGSVCMGLAYPSPEPWYKPLSSPPDGTYAIFRCNEDTIECLTDFTGSRSIWYYKDDKIFVAGTSQRAVITIAGKFELNKKVLPWMLSSGSLGHLNSWSKDVKSVGLDGAVILNRHTWELSTRQGSVEYVPSKLSDKEIEEQFKKIVFDSFKNISTDFSQWLLPMSGGYDSRAIACILKKSGNDISKLETITWGTHESRQDKDSDGYLGVEVSKALNLKNNFYETDKVNEPLEIVFERFILCSEGRIDHILGYTDGLAIWRDIFYSLKQGVIRGDETLGAPAVGSYLRARLMGEIKLCTDFSNLEDYEQYGFEKQEMPESYKEIPGEGPDTSKDRLYQEYRLPNVLPALSDLKFCYTEVLNPFMSRAIVEFSRTIPDHLRANRVMYKKMLDGISPDVKYAAKKATGKFGNVLTKPEAIRLMLAELKADYMKEIFPEAYIAKIIGKLEKTHEEKKETIVGKIKGAIRRNMPLFLKELLRKNLPKQTEDNFRIGFRMYMTGKVYKMFNEDLRQAKELENRAQLSASIS